MRNPMKKTYRWAVIFWSILLLTPSSAQADFYMKAKTMGFASETWTAGKKQRMQTQTPMAGSMITIVRVDKGVEWTVNSKMKIYQEKPIALTPKDIQEQDSGMAEIKNLMPQKQQGSDCTPQMNRLSEKRTYAGYETEGYQWACKEQPASMTMWIAPAQGDLARVEKETEAYSDAYQKELFH